MSILTRRDYENYLVYLYFGSNPNILACANRAYLDFNRTLHGFSKFEKSGELHDKAVILLMESFESLKSLSTNPNMFDNWHRETCKKLVSLFDNQGFHLFIGQAQKWVNMTLKYVFTLGEQRVPGFEFAYPYCHAPLDNIFLERLKKYDFPALNCAWSRLDDYDEYFKKQMWLRTHFNIPALDIEFQLWMENEKLKGNA